MKTNNKDKNQMYNKTQYFNFWDDWVSNGSEYHNKSKRKTKLTHLSYSNQSSIFILDMGLNNILFS